jgi:hypothetical protein
MMPMAMPLAFNEIPVIEMEEEGNIHLHLGDLNLGISHEEEEGGEDGNYFVDARNFEVGGVARKKVAVAGEGQAVPTVPVIRWEETPEMALTLCHAWIFQ